MRRLSPIVILCLIAAARPAASQSVLPSSFAGWNAAEAPVVVPSAGFDQVLGPDAAIFREYFLKSLERRAYTQGGQTTLSIDPKILNSNDGSNEWLMYDLTRIAWAKGDFFKNYPDEKEYRHSLKEEAAALRMVAEAAAKDLKSGKIKALEPSLAMLVKLNEDGFLEAYVLFAHPDQGIARDYAAYRKDNREKLRRYWLEVVIGRS